MPEQFYTILTKMGKAKIANATALGTKVNLTRFQVGDSGGTYYNPTEDQKQLRNKVWESNISSITIDEENPNWIVLEVVIPSSVGGFMVREAGVFDDEGNMIAVGKYPETYKPQVQDGSIKDLLIKMILEVSNTASVTLKVDPTVILATKKDIEVLENKINNIKIPVTSVNDKTGAINLTAGDIKAADGKTLEAFKTSTESELAQLTIKQGNLATLKTTEKTNLVGAVNELFTNANNGKQNWVDVIGSPLLITDTFSTLKDKTQTLKNTMATNLTAKGQTSVGTESLNSLINKIPNISTGKKWASGQIPVKTVPLGETLNNPISGLDFLPSVIVAVGGTYPATYTPMKTDQGVAGNSNPGIDMNIQSVYMGGFYIKYTNNGSTYTTKSNIIYWYAFE